MRDFFKGFVYAARGFCAAVKAERNLRFHLTVAVFVVYFGRFYAFGRGEWAAIALAIGGVIGLELVNSALERAVDKPAPERFYMAGPVKDMAAAGVLAYSVGAAAAGLCLFWQPDVIRQVFLYFTEAAYRPVLLLAALALAWRFVFRNNK